MDKRFIDKLDAPLLIFGGLVVIAGLLNLYSATYGLSVARYFNNQIVWVSLGTAVALTLSFINYNIYERLCYPLYIICVIMLFLVLHISTPVAGSERWLRFGGIGIQPSELMKPVIIFAIARHFSKRDDRPPYTFFQLIGPLIIMLIPMILIHLQPDLGTTIALAITGFSMILFVGVQRKSLIYATIFLMVFIPIAWFFLISDYQKGRVVTFLEPEKYRQEGGYQVTQAKIAVGSGMLTGKGFLKGSQTKLMFLPKQHTDFVFSNFAEEWGFLGCVGALFLYLMFIMSGLNIAMRAKDRFGMLLAFGFTCYFFWHVFINIAMELGMLPVVGIPLPLFSYGGSITLTSFVAIGILLSVNVRRYMF